MNSLASAGKNTLRAGVASLAFAAGVKQIDQSLTLMNNSRSEYI